MQELRPIGTEHPDLLTVCVVNGSFAGTTHVVVNKSGLPETKVCAVHAFCRERPLGVYTSRSTMAEVLVEDVTPTVKVTVSPIRTLDGLIVAMVVHPFDVRSS